MSTNDSDTLPLVVSGEQRAVCSGVMATMLGMGIAGCILIIYGILKNHQVSTFNVICITRTIGNLIVVVVFLITHVPMAMTGTSFFPILLNAWITYIAIFIYTFNQMLCMLLAVNRFIALWLPLNYKILCHNYSTVFCLVVLVLLTLVRSGNPLRSPDCLLNFDGYYMALTMTSEHCTSLDSEEMIVNIIIAATVIINIVTFSKCIWLLTDGLTKFLRTTSEDRTKKNIVLFFQFLLVVLGVITIVRSGNPLRSPDCLMNFDAYTMGLTVTPKNCTSLDPEGAVVEYIFAASIAVNIITFAKCSWLLTGGCRGSRYFSSSTENRTRKNIILFFQTVLQDLLFVIDITFTTKIFRFLRNSGIVPLTWAIFIGNTFAWLLVYAADSVIMLIFQPELIMKKKDRISSNQVTTTI